MGVLLNHVAEMRWPRIMPTWAYCPSNVRLAGEHSTRRANKAKRKRERSNATTTAINYLHAAHQFFRPKTDVRVKTDRSARRQAAIQAATAEKNAKR